jgi:flavin-binding protein dodecin
VPGHTYKLIELVGTSEESVSDAIDAAVDRANETLKGLEWFEVQSIRGRIEEGAVAEYQVSVKIGFRVMTPEELAGEPS